MPISDRSLLIALNAHPRIMRGAICRLGLDTSLWRGVKKSSSSAASQLGVPARQLGYALESLRRADRTASHEQRKAEEAGASILTLLDDQYPPALLDHPLPPPVLYCRGRIPAGPAIGIVGSRRCDNYGAEAARYFGAELGAAGVVVVSGFALGVDQAAHRGTLSTGGLTVAVLGCGLDIPYPRKSTDLADDISRNGGVVSEFPMGRPPRNWNFPVRNRVIASLSQGVLVVQAKIRSGSLITAHAALELGRDVYAVPGRIFDELSLGTNSLLADGAIPANSADDLLGPMGMGRQQELFPPTAEAAAQPEPEAKLPGLVGKVLDSMPRGDAGKTAEEIARGLDVGVDRVLGALLELELAGRIERRPGPIYGR